MILFLIYLLTSLLIFVYSYGFLDYNLTLSSHPLFMRFVDYFQDIVFFNRPLSARIYLLILCMTTIAYFLTIFTLHNRQTFPWKPIILVGLVLALSYPMFTHDIFNYLFHAKAVIVYNINPHLVPPQEFAGDEWLRFMHWVHNPSAYGHGFTAYMLIPFVLGMTKLVPSLYLYKLMSFGWYLLAIFLIGKISEKTKLIKPVQAQLLFAANPLIILEWLVNAHNESMMVTLMLLAWYLASKGRGVAGWLALGYGVLSKYAAILITPGLILKRLVGEHKSLMLTTLILLATPFFYHYPSQYQVWYITWAIPFAILSGNKYLTVATIGYSFGGLLTYVPYIATGFWSLTPSSRELYLLSASFVSITILWLYYLITQKLYGQSK